MNDVADRPGWHWVTPPDTAAWPARMRSLQGEFGRPTGFRVSTFVILAIWIGVTMVVLSFLWGLVLQVQHPAGSKIILGAFAAFFIFVMAKTWRRVGLKYVFRDGTISALGTYGQELWTERLEQLQAVRYQRNRGVVLLTLVWPDRERDLLGVQSLLDALQRPDGSGRSMP